MKKNLLAAMLMFMVAALSAQVPQGINYQAVARNSAGNVLANTTVSLQLTVHDVTATGVAVYQEIQTVSTNQFGLFTVVIGSGTATVGTFAGVNWGAGNKFLQVELEVNGNGNMIDMGTSKLQSVPYALYAGVAAAARVADTVLHLPAAPIALWDTADGNIYNTNTGYVGIGTALPYYTLHVVDSSDQEQTVVNVENKGGDAARLRLTTKNNHYASLTRYPNVSPGTINTIPTNNLLEMYNDAGDMMIDVYLHNIYFATNGYTNNMAITPTGIGIGTNTPNASAALDITSTTGAFLQPRMNTAQRNALTPAEGMTIYNTDLHTFQGYAGTKSPLLSIDAGSSPLPRSIVDGYWVMHQSFSVPIMASWTIGAVSILTDNVSTAASGVFSILSGDGTAGTVMYTQPFNYVDCVSNNCETTIYLTTPFMPSMGSQYTLRFSVGNGQSFSTFTNVANPYSGGQVYQNTTSLPAEDMYLRLYVTGLGWVDLH